MKKIFALLAMLALIAPHFTFAAAPSNTIGRILLQVEARGEAWYVDPVSQTRYYLRDGDAAYQALRQYGLGISNADLRKIPVDTRSWNIGLGDSDGDGLYDKLEEALGTDYGVKDSDGDGYSDATEVASGYDPRGSAKIAIDGRLIERLKGRIVLQVEGQGEAWYINPVDGKRYYLHNGAVAYQIMRNLGLGITNQDLAKINPVATGGLSSIILCSKNDFACFWNHIQAANNVSVHIDMEYYYPEVEATHLFIGYALYVSDLDSPDGDELIESGIHLSSEQSTWFSESGNPTGWPSAIPKGEYFCSNSGSQWVASSGSQAERERIVDLIQNFASSGRLSSEELSFVYAACMYSY